MPVPQQATCALNRSSTGASTSYPQFVTGQHRRAARAAAGGLQQGRPHCTTSAGKLRHGVLVSAATAAGAGEIVEVDALKGIRVLKNEDDTPRVEYLVKWKDGSPDTWEPATNLADNLLRDFEQRWWGAVKQGNEQTLYDMMAVGGDVLARTDLPVRHVPPLFRRPLSHPAVNEDRRSALHFAAAMGKAELVQRLVQAGAEVDLGDREGFTPLHMAAGYMHTSTIGALLAGGADPEQADRQGRSPLQLVESLRAALPAGNPMVVQRRMQLEGVIQMLTANMFEEVEPAAVLGKRQRLPGEQPPEEAVATAEGGSEAASASADGAADTAAAGEGAAVAAERQEGAEAEAKQGAEGEEKKEEEVTPAGPLITEWLIKFADDEEPMWVEEKYVSQEVVEDYEAGLEYAQAECVVDMRQRGTMRKYLVRWRDDYPDTWEPEEHVSPDLIALWEKQQRGEKGEDGNSSSNGSNGSGAQGSTSNGSGKSSEEAGLSATVGSSGSGVEGGTAAGVQLQSAPA